MSRPEGVRAIGRALRDNPECRLGVMARTRVAFAEKGVNSYRRDKELLVLISSNDGWWYAYVVRVDPGILAFKDRGEWMAILVKSTHCVEGETPQDVLSRIEHFWYSFGWYESYYTPERSPEEGLVQCFSFDDAIQAACRMIARFNHRCRMRSEAGGGLRLDMRCHNFFAGLGHSDAELRTMHDSRELPILEGSRNKDLKTVPPHSGEVHL